MDEFIAGPNFSGRSAALMAWLRERAPAFFVGPYAEGALSGLSGTVAAEIASPASLRTWPESVAPGAIVIGGISDAPISPIGTVASSFRA